jgi:hypothetical protein
MDVTIESMAVIKIIVKIIFARNLIISTISFSDELICKVVDMDILYIIMIQLATAGKQPKKNVSALFRSTDTFISMINNAVKL